MSAPVLAICVALAVVVLASARFRLPTLEVGRDLVRLRLTPGISRRIDLSGLGAAYAGHASVPIKMMVTAYFYTAQHQQALGVAGSFAPPDQHTCDMFSSVQLVTGGNDALLQDMVEAINARRPPPHGGEPPASLLSASWSRCSTLPSGWVQARE